MKIGVLTGGGDCPGLNPAIKAIVNQAYEEGHGIIGIREGWKGLLKAKGDYIIELNPDSVRTIDRIGGTILGTSRTNPFKSKEAEKKLLRNIKNLNLEGIIAIGGEDTLGVAAKLYKSYSIPIVGVPKTIDKDLSETDYTLGFSSAVEEIMQDIERLRTTTGSHKRVMVIETMGRHAGHLALVGGLAGGADMILIPEYDFDIKRINRLLLKRKREGKRYSIVVVSEGAKPKNADESLSDKGVDEFGHARLGGIGNSLAKAIGKGTGIEARCTVLSHLQRGGSPSHRDRIIGYWFGVAAVEALTKERYGRMVSLKGNEIVLANLDDAVRELQLVDTGKHYDSKNYNVKKGSILGKSIYV
ncbi:MAG: ATP-dependent 6-phosphofructokinase [Nanoarchaeota archaeon]|nr:ATP-dependent 6-phosphofructokinase [Nanoarchaeota archaeon]